MFSNPWRVTPSFITWIRHHVKVGRTILEFGSGDGTTRELCNSYRLYSVENDKLWLNKYDSTYIYAPLVDGWYDMNCVRAVLPETYDLLIVDGPYGENRVNMIKHFSAFRQDVPVMVDDADRFGVRKIVAHLISLGYSVVGGDRRLAVRKWLVLAKETT